MPKVLYEIVVRGIVPEALIADLEGFEVASVRDGDTTLRGWVVDQSGLHGVLARIVNSGLQLSKAAPVGE